MAVSAGVLLYRRAGPSLEVLLIHPGGPFFVRKDLGAWSIPKGEQQPEENPLQAACREFQEETGATVSGPFLDLGNRRQRSGKRVHVFALEGDFDPAALVSNTFQLEFPPGSGHLRTYPEADRAAWFPLDVARTKIIAGQEAFLDALLAALNPPPAGPSAPGQH